MRFSAHRRSLFGKAAEAGYSQTHGSIPVQYGGAVGGSVVSNDQLPFDLGHRPDEVLNPGHTFPKLQLLVVNRNRDMNHHQQK